MIVAYVGNYKNGLTWAVALLIHVSDLDEICVHWSAGVIREPFAKRFTQDLDPEVVCAERSC